MELKKIFTLNNFSLLLGLLVYLTFASDGSITALCSDIDISTEVSPEKPSERCSWVKPALIGLVFVVGVTLLCVSCNGGSDCGSITSSESLIGPLGSSSGGSIASSESSESLVSLIDPLGSSSSESIESLSGMALDILSPVSTFLPSSEMLPAVVSSAAVAVASPAVVSSPQVVVSGTRHIIGVPEEFRNAIFDNLVIHRPVINRFSNLNDYDIPTMYESFMEAAQSHSFEYLSRFMEGLQNVNIQTFLNFIFVTREPNSENSLYCMFADIINSGVSNSASINDTISNFYHSNGIDLLNLAQTLTQNSMGHFLMSSESNIYNMLLSTFIVVILTLFEYNVIVTGLLTNNGCQIFASLFFDRVEWAILDVFITNNASMEGVKLFINKFLDPELRGDDYNDSVIGNLFADLYLRDHNRRKIFINDVFVLITLFTDVVKGFLEHNVHELVSKRF